MRLAPLALIGFLPRRVCLLTRTLGLSTSSDTIEHSFYREGVRVIDLYTANRTFVLNDVIDRHRFAVLIDVDSTLTLASNPDKLVLMRSLISETKPSYTTFLSACLSF